MKEMEWDLAACDDAARYPGAYESWPVPRFRRPASASSKAAMVGIMQRKVDYCSR